MDLVKEKIESGDIHLFSVLSQNFLFDPTTHSVFSIPSTSLSDLSEEIEQAIQTGFFCRKEKTEFEDNRVFKSLCLMITHQCNFSCSYCFEKAKGNNQKENVMSLDIGKKSLELISELSLNRTNIEVDFFGGEPLLYFDTLRDIVYYGRELEKKFGKKFWFSLTTNASLLNQDMINFFHVENISLILSLDGDKNSHDRFRTYHDGGGTYHDTMNGIQQIIQSNHEGYYIRGTYTKETPDFPEQVLFLQEQGIQQISFEPVVSKDPGIGFNQEDLSDIRRKYEKLAITYLTQRKTNPKLRFYHFEVNLEEGSCLQKLMTSCGAGVEYLSVSPSGILYPCHQFDGNPSYELGNIEEGIKYADLVERFRHLTQVSNKDKCNVCWARTLCGGGCLANNLSMNGNIENTYDLGCEIQKIRLEIALYVQVKLKELCLNETP